MFEIVKMLDIKLKALIHPLLLTPIGPAKNHALLFMCWSVKKPQVRVIRLGSIADETLWCLHIQKGCCFLSPCVTVNYVEPSEYQYNPSIGYCP